MVPAQTGVSPASTASSFDRSARASGIPTVDDNLDWVGILMGEVALHGEVTLLRREIVGKGGHAALPDMEPEERHRQSDQHPDGQGQHDDTVAQNSFDEPSPDPRLARIRASETLPDNGQAQGVHTIAE